MLELLAQATPNAQQAPGCSYANLFPILLMFLVIYFLFIRPQNKQQKEHQSLLASLKKGDEVVTQGGVIGKVHAVTDRIVTLEVGRDQRMRVLKSSVTGMYVEPSPEAEASKS